MVPASLVRRVEGPADYLDGVSAAVRLGKLIVAVFSA